MSGAGSRYGDSHRLFLEWRMRKFTGLRVWLRSHQLTLEIYRESDGFPPKYRYGITAQLLRAIASVPTNLAEGAKCESDLEFANYVHISEKSLAESQYLLMLHKDLGCLAERREQHFQREAAGIARQLHALKVSIRGNVNE